MNAQSDRAATRCARDIALEDLIAETTKVLGDGLYALAYTPRRARFLLLRDKIPEDECAEEWADYRHAFEVRLFSSEGEVSWRRDGTGGRALLTVDDERVVDGAWSATTTPISRLGTGQRLIWGELDRPLASGWFALSSPRTGPIHVPPFEGAIAPQTGQRALLRVVEYARVADSDGNVVAAGERLAGFDWHVVEDGTS